MVFFNLKYLENERQLSQIIWGKIRQVYPPKNFLTPISLKVRKIIVPENPF